ncbi:MAG: efflux RND transporter periplasmic adaptor subunit [Steroidobacteraceae bacterium]
MSPRLLAVLAFAAAALVTAVLTKWDPEQIAPAHASTAEAEPAALTISVASVKRESWVQAVTASGAVMPWQESVIGAQLNGLLLSSIEVDVGDVVKKGQILARFDDALLRADVERLSASLSRADAEAVQADRDAKRAESLRGIGALSEQSILASITQSQVAAATMKSARAELHAKQVELSYTVLRASDDGVISERTATVGTVTESGQALFKLIRQQRLEWRGEVSAAQLAGIKKGQTVALDLPDGASATASVRQVAPTLNADSRMALVYADLHPGSNARAGMYAAGRIGLTESQALVVPSSSIVVRDGRSYAFVVTRNGDTGRINARAVNVGRREGRFVEVSGLSEGMDVAENGAGFLADGDLVRIAKPIGSTVSAAR